MWRAAALVVAGALALAGCPESAGSGADLSVAAGPDLAPPAICSDPVVPDGGVPATFTNVQRIFDAQCTVCHGGGEVDLSAGQSYAAIVNQPAPAGVDACGGTLVHPFDPAGSYLFIKVSSDTPCGGQRMPRGEFGSTPLPDCQIDVIRRWIAAGAPND